MNSIYLLFLNTNPTPNVLDEQPTPKGRYYDSQEKMRSMRFSPSTRKLDNKRMRATGNVGQPRGQNH
jgi:hypothetical protein